MQTGRPKAHIVTYGCQMNENDSEILLAYLEELGYEWTGQADDADLILLNTCCVRASAEQKAMGRLGQFKALKDQNPDLFIGVAGCMPQQPGAAQAIAQKAPHANLVFGTHNIHRFPQLFEQSRGAGTPVVDIAQEPETLPVFPRGRRAAGIGAWVTILRGCDKRCTYCIVPYVRGRELSRPIEEIVDEVAALVDEGVREVTLLGQNVNAYGHDLPGGRTNFATLISALDEVEGLWRIRYTTSHPRDFTQEMIETLAASPKVCEHYHIPVQSGANAMLKRMARGYKVETYLSLVERVRQADPGASLTTDLIVGFPGETEEDFQKTLDLVSQVRFDRSFTFMFSPRKGTPAASFPDQVPIEVKKERLQRLMALQDGLSLESQRRQVGKTVEVLVEGPSRTRSERTSGRTRDGRIVVFDESRAAGTLAWVKIEEAKTFSLEGVAVPSARGDLAV